LAALGPPAEHQGDIQVSRPVQTPGTHYGIEYKLELLPAATAEKQFNIDTREAQLDAVINTDEEYFTWPWPLGWLPGATECFTVAVWAKVQHAADVREVVQTPHGAGAFPVLSHHGSGTGWQVSMSADLAEFMVTLHKYPGIHHRKASSQYPTPTGELAGDVWYHLAGTYDGKIVRFYINGKLSAETEADIEIGEIKIAGFKHAEIGRNPCWHDLRFRGKVAFPTVHQMQCADEEEIAHIAMDRAPPGSIDLAQARVEVALSQTPLPEGFYRHLRKDEATEALLVESASLSKAFIASEAEAKEDGCPHTHATFWGGADEPWHCASCSAVFPAERIPPEELLMSAILEADGDDHAVNSARSLTFGVSVEFLIAFTGVHDCWDWPTWQVVRDVIKPVTFANDRCRYAELPYLHEPPHDMVGPPDVFASHCWGAPFGDLVAAVSFGAQHGRKVSFQICAVLNFTLCNPKNS